MEPAGAAEIDMPIEDMRIYRGVRYVYEVRDKLRDRPGVFRSFAITLRDYRYHRIDIPDVLGRVLNLFDGHPELLKGFCDFLPYTLESEDEVACDDMEDPRPAEKAKDDGIKPLEPGPSYATAACSDNYCSADVCGAAEEAAQLERRILYVTETERKPFCGPEVYENFLELLREIRANRSDTYDVMERASTSFQGYPELIKGFNKFLPDGFRIVILPNNHDMIID